MKVSHFIWVILFLSSSVSAVVFYDQGTGVVNSTSDTLTLGNLSILIYDSFVGGNLVFSENYTDAIVNGSWNVKVDTDLEYGKSYYKDYEINGDNMNFSGEDRIEFNSPYGVINNASFINFSLIDSCSSGSSIRQIYSNGSVVCETDDLWSISGAKYLYNNSGVLSVNETALNATIDSRQVSADLSNYALKNESVVFSGNVSTSSYGFFGWLGSALSRITSLFVQNVNAINITLNGTTIESWDEVNSSSVDTDTHVAGSGYLYNDSTTMYLNESLLNSTIDSKVSSKADYEFSSNNFNGSGNFTTSGNVSADKMYKSGVEVATFNDLVSGNITVTSVETIQNQDSVSVVSGTPMKFTGYNLGQDRQDAIRANNTISGEHADCLVLGTIASGASGQCVVYGKVTGVDTSGFGVGEDLYLNESLGTLTNIKPVNASCVQKVGMILRVHGSQGVIWVNGAGRCNDVPSEININGNITTVGNVSASYFVGDGSLLNVNSTTWWSGLTSWLTGWLVNNAGQLEFNETKLNETIDARSSGVSYEFGSNNFNGSGNFTTTGNITADSVFIGENGTLNIGSNEISVGSDGLVLNGQNVISSKYVLHTGLISGGQMTINATNDTQFDIAQTECLFVNRTNTSNINITRKVFPAKGGVIAEYLTTNTGAFIGYYENGTVVQSVPDFERDETAEICRIGRISHFYRTAITQTYYYPLTVDTDLDLAEWIMHKGVIKMRGLEIEKGNGTMNLKRTAGESLRIGAGLDAFNHPETPEEDNFTFLLVHNNPDSTTTIEGEFTEIDTEHYDDESGVLQNVSSGKYVNLFVYFFPNKVTDTTFILRSSEEYNSLNDAVLALSDIPTINDDLSGGIILAGISVRQGMTNLSEALADSSARIVNANDFGDVDPTFEYESLAGTALSTGILTGGTLTINSTNTSFLDVAAGSAIIADYSDLSNPHVYEVSWDAQTIYPNLYGLRSKWIGVNRTSNGSVELVVSQEFSALEKRTIAVLGRCWGSGTDTITGKGQYSTPAFGSAKTLEDLIDALGSLNIYGNVFSANGANMLLDKSAGRSFRFASNFAALPSSPNIRDDAAQSGRTSYAYHLQGSTSTTTETQIDSLYYDNVGVKTALSNNQWTVQRIYFFPGSGTVHVVYGQHIYSSLAEAKDAISSESVVLNTDILSGSILRGWIVLKKGATDLSNAAEAEIISATSTLTGGSSSGGVSSHASLDTLEWSSAGHTFSTASLMDIGSYNFTTDGRVGIGANPNGSYQLYVNGTVCLDLNKDGACDDTTSALSDERIKKNIFTIERALEKLKLLRGVSFDWNESYSDLNLGNKSQIGFIAQEVETVLPEVVTNGIGKYNLKAVDYGKVVALVVEAVKEVNNKVDIQEERIAELENENDELKNVICEELGRMC